MKQSMLQSLIALVISTRRDLKDVKDIMAAEGELHYELAEPMSPLGSLHFKKLNITLNEIRKLDRKLKKLDNILPVLKKELKQRVNHDNAEECRRLFLGERYSTSNYVVNSFEVDGRKLTTEQAFRIARL